MSQWVLRFESNPTVPGDSLGFFALVRIAKGLVLRRKCPIRIPEGFGNPNINANVGERARVLLQGVSGFLEPGDDAQEYGDASHLRDLQ